MNELALFAGAGGGLLASHLLGWRTVCAVEYEPHAASILIQRQNDRVLPPFPVWDDIRTFDGARWRGHVDIVSGGFPCQAYSSASRGRAVADDLWPEMRRVVADVAPRYVFAENTERRAINRAADDLEAMGYKTRAAAISAQDVGADHIRERHWLLAYADSDRELRMQVNAEMAELPLLRHRVWEAYTDQSGMDDGVAYRMDRFAAIGNGQVPVVAIAALLTLLNTP